MIEGIVRVEEVKVYEDIGILYLVNRLTERNVSVSQVF